MDKWSKKEKMKLKVYRRIVTNGKEFKIQLRHDIDSDWEFYPSTYLTLKEAKQRMNKWNEEDEDEIKNEWKVVD